MDKKKTTAIVLLDMNKAFDSINHGILGADYMVPLTRD